MNVRRGKCCGWLSPLTLFMAPVMTLVMAALVCVSAHSSTPGKSDGNSFPGWDAPYLSPKTELNSLSETLRAYGALADIMRINVARMKAQLREKLDADPGDSLACIMLGDILIEDGVLQLALVMFDSAVALAPTYPAGRLALGRANYKLKDFPSAIAQFDTSIFYDSTNATGWSLRAIAHSMNDNWLAARSDFERANQIRTLSREERYRYALCLWATGDLDIAIDEFEKSIQGRGSDYRIYVSWGMAEASRGNLNEARRGLAHAMEIRKPDERLFEALADINALDGLADSTAYYLERAVELAPFQTRLRNRLGLVYAFLKEFDRADEMFEISTSLESEGASGYANWARAKALQGDFTAAAKLIDRALRLAPLDETILRLREEILPGLPLMKK
jgi:tetratricopeptide (TPR) repeat protein